jgi:hypothetical protein
MSKKLTTYFILSLFLVATGFAQSNKEAVNAIYLENMRALLKYITS